MPLFSSIKDASFFSDLKAAGSLSSSVAKVTELVNRATQSSTQNQPPPPPPQQQYQPYQTQQGYNQQLNTPGYGVSNSTSTSPQASCQSFATTGTGDSTGTIQDSTYGNTSQGCWTSTPSYDADPGSVTDDSANMEMATQANISAEESAAADQEATSAIDESNEFTSDLNENLYGDMAADEGCSVVDDDDVADEDDVSYDNDDGV